MSEHESLIAIQGEGSGVGDVRIGADDPGDHFLMFSERLERNILPRDGDAEKEPAVLARNEAGRHGEEKINGTGKQYDREHRGRELMPQHGFQSAIVSPSQTIEAPFEDTIQSAVARAVVVAQKTAAQHRRERERDEARHKDRYCDGHGEFVQQAAHHAAHEQHRDKYGYQRHGH